MKYRQIIHLKTGTTHTGKWFPGDVQTYIDESTRMLDSEFSGFDLKGGGMLVTDPKNIDFIEVEFKEN